MISNIPFLVALGAIGAQAQYLSVNYYSATYSPSNAPQQSEEGQTGTNQCGTGVSVTSQCQNLYLNSLDDFCLYAPPSSTSDYGESSIGNTERIEVSYCLATDYGARQLPASSISGAHLVITPEYAQITGVGSLDGLNIIAGDDGGELDPHGADGNGNPIGGLVFSSIFGGGVQQIHEWTQFIGAGYFCIRICPDGPNAAAYCNHIYDTLGCDWNMPGDYSEGFSTCQGDATEPMGVYGTSTFHQGDASTPAAHATSAVSSCLVASSLAGAAVLAPATTTTASSSTSAASSVASASVSSSAASSQATSTSQASSSSSSSSSSASAATLMSTSLASSAPTTTRSTSTSQTTGSTTAAAASQSATSGAEAFMKGALWLGLSAVVGALGFLAIF